MEISQKQQVVEQLRLAKSVLIVMHENPDGDSIGSALALAQILKKQNKKVTVACADKPSNVFTFAPYVDEIKNSLGETNEFVISIPKEGIEIDKLGYKTTDSKLQIVLMLKKGKIDADRIEFPMKESSYDLIVALDTPNLERLGSLSQPADIFFTLPVVNIDHHPSNEYFGQINWIDFTATSTCEMMVSLIEAIAKGEQMLNSEIATLLLLGIIYDTSSFQNINTTPKSLTIAAQLVAAGGKQQEIVKNLYKTKSIETLKLWGTILSNVREDKLHRFIWSKASKTNFEEAGADESAVSGVIDELLKKVSDLDFAMVLSERQDVVHGSLRSIAKAVDVSRIAELFGGGGHEAAAAFRVEGNLVSKQDEILTRIRQFQSKVGEVTQKAEATAEVVREPKVEESAEPAQDESEPVKKDPQTKPEVVTPQEEMISLDGEQASDDFSKDDEEPKTKW